jgi:hypothetical protein
MRRRMATPFAGKSSSSLKTPSPIGDGSRIYFSAADPHAAPAAKFFSRCTRISNRRGSQMQMIRHVVVALHLAQLRFYP